MEMKSNLFGPSKLTVSTVKILSFRAYRFISTVETKIILLLMNRSDLGLHSCLIPFMHLCRLYTIVEQELRGEIQ